MKYVYCLLGYYFAVWFWVLIVLYNVKGTKTTKTILLYKNHKMCLQYVA